MTTITTQFDFEPIREIGVGQGRNSKVYLAKDPKTLGEIAVKVIPKSDFPSPNEYFVEAKSMKAAECPNVVPINVCCETADTIYIVMPYFKNGSLMDRVTKAPLRLIECISVGQGILTGLGQIHHSARIIHFDLKPSNVLFADNGDVMVADFGQSRPIDATGLSAIPGMYVLAMPPEAITSRHGSFVSDVFQAGLTAYRMLNGNDYFESQFLKYPDQLALQNAIVLGKFPDRNAFLPHVPKWLRTVVRKALKVSPTEPHSSAREFAEALKQPI